MEKIIPNCEVCKKPLPKNWYKAYNKYFCTLKELEKYEKEYLEKSNKNKLKEDKI